MSAGDGEAGIRVGPWREERIGAGAGADGAARWIPVGTRGSGTLGLVDPAGLVGPVDAGWSLDWWVGAEDRWHLPAREAAVRQELVEHSPVVETRLRVPGGDIVHRAFGAQGSAAMGGREAIVVELANRTPVPVAVALAVRPYAVDVGGSIRRIVPHGDRVVDVDGSWTLIADRGARNMAGAGDGTDPLAVVTRGEAAATWAPVEDERGRASFVLIFPLPHTASMRLALVPGEPPADPASAIDGLPGADAVASGWARQADRGLRVVLPDAALDAAFTAARRRLLLGAPDLPAARVGTEQALICRALSSLGHHDELRPVVGELLGRQRLTGAIPDEIGSEAATGAALAVLGWWQRFDPRPELLAEVAGPVAKAAQRIDRRRNRRRRRGDPARQGLLPEGPQPVELAGPTVAYLDDWWSAAGLLQASALLATAGQAQPAAESEQVAGMVLDRVEHSAASADPGDEAIPVGPGRSIDEGIVGLLPALAPLGVVDGGAAGVAATLDLIHADLVDDAGWVRAGAAGDTASPWLTACLALHEVARGDRRALDRLDRLVRAGGPTASWPRRLDERGAGRGGQGDDPVATALFLQLVRSVLVRERRPAPTARPVALDVLSLMPPSWMGQGIEVHDAPTTFGPFGFAVRWHGERPALLWELRAAPDGAMPTIACPGLAPGWSTTEPVGETLLPAPGGSAAAMMDDDASFS